MISPDSKNLVDSTVGADTVCGAKWGEVVSLDHPVSDGDQPVLGSKERFSDGDDIVVDALLSNV